MKYQDFCKLLSALMICLFYLPSLESLSYSDKNSILFEENLKNSEELIKGIDPITGLIKYFIPYEPSPGRTNILFIIDDIFLYTENAGISFSSVNPKQIDIRKVDVVVA